MTTLDALLAAEAAVSGNAQRRSLVRHRHLSGAPLVIVAYRLAGEAGAPLGIMIGTNPGDSTLLVAPEPRNREMRFREVFNPLATAVGEWLAGFSEREEPNSRKPRQLPAAKDAPQILVPNRATLDFIGSVFGRSLRYLRSSDDFLIPDETVILGAHASWFSQQSEVPGSCVLVAATDLLRRHWTTGQSDLEDEDLHVLLSWLDPPEGVTGGVAANSMEQSRVDGLTPAIGPTPDASWDRDVLDRLLTEFNTRRAGDASVAIVGRLGGDIQAAVAEALFFSWEATWRAYSLLMALDPGRSVDERWRSDRYAWSSHLARVEQGRAYFRTRDSARQSAWMIKSREDAQQALDLGEALDDPLVFAGLMSAGDAILGDVVVVDTSNMEMGPSGRRRVRRPLVELKLTEPCVLPVGTTLRWTEEVKRFEAVLVRADSEQVVLKVTKGMNGQLPAAGSTVGFLTLAATSYPAPSAPSEIPWTHVGAFTPEPDSEVPE